MVHFKEDKTQYQSTLFAHAGKDMKIGTHCSGFGDHETNHPHNQFIIREYAAYRILEEAGFMGYKARLVRMNYKDLSGNSVAKGYAFFLEPDGKMAKRWGYENVKRSESYKHYPTDKEQASFMLGKTLVGGMDHSVGHNTTILTQEGKAKAMTFYDLDMSLLANPYFFNKFTGKKEVDPQADVHQVRSFIEDHPEGKKKAEAFLDEATKRRDGMLRVIDNLPIEEKASMKDRIETWVGAINHVRKGTPVPAPARIPTNFPPGMYTRW